MAGRTTSDKADRVKAYQQINQYLAQDIPYLWLARDTWAVVANPKVQNFANPTTRAGLEGHRLRRGRALADADLDEVGRPLAGVGQRISTSSRYSSRQWVKRSSGSRRQ